VDAQAAVPASVLSRAIDRLRLRSIRGSNWGEPAAFVRASYRKFQRPDYSTHWLGFRLARDWCARR
jgi:formylglycine-generating enzyme required for sulfatase activity